MNTTIDLLKALIERPSITPADAMCQQLIADELEDAGFQVSHLPYGEVENLWAWHGDGAPVFTFLGHTDVVPPGPEVDWSSPPFQATEKDGYLFGRGAADMKGSLAAMVTALKSFVAEQPAHTGTVGLLLTSDEEGPAINGIQKVVPALMAQGVKIDHCLVGEPSSQAQLGDVVRIGRRGSMSGLLTVRGVQGHVAYPEQADNPVHRMLGALQRLVIESWDAGTDDFPATSFQISNLRAGDGSANVIPGQAQVLFNFRFSPATTSADLQNRVAAILQQEHIDYDLKWQLSGEPFYTAEGPLVEAVRSSVRSVCEVEPVCNTGGGTSDGRFVAPTGAAVVELGPVNATIHKVDECVSMADVNCLATVYQQVLRQLMTAKE